MSTIVSSIFTISGESFERFLKHCERSEVAFITTEYETDALLNFTRVPIKFLDSKLADLDTEALFKAKSGTVFNFIDLFLKEELMSKQMRLIRHLVETYQLKEEIIYLDYVMTKTKFKFRVRFEGSAGFVTISKSLDKLKCYHDIVTYSNLGSKLRFVLYTSCNANEINTNRDDLSINPEKISNFIKAYTGIENGGILLDKLTVENHHKKVMSEIGQYFMSEMHLHTETNTDIDLFCFLQTYLKRSKYEDDILVTQEILDEFTRLGNIVINLMKNGKFYYEVISLFM